MATMKKSKYIAKSDAFEAIHSAAIGMHRVGIINQQAMHDFNEACLIQAPPQYSGDDVKRIREKMNVPQDIFAAYLNTTIPTIKKWEAGDAVPSGPAAKLLAIIDKHGLKILS